MKSALQNFLRNLFGPAPVAVDDAVAQLTHIEERLKATFSAQSELAGTYRTLAHQAEEESVRALRVSAKINQLLS